MHEICCGTQTTASGGCMGLRITCQALSPTSIIVVHNYLQTEAKEVISEKKCSRGQRVWRKESL